MMPDSNIAMLENLVSAAVSTKYKEVPSFDKLMIMMSATILTAILSYFLFPKDKQEKPDEIPSHLKK